MKLPSWRCFAFQAAANATKSSPRRSEDCRSPPGNSLDPSRSNTGAIRVEARGGSAGKSRSTSDPPSLVGKMFSCRSKSTSLPTSAGPPRSKSTSDPILDGATSPTSKQTLASAHETRPPTNARCALMSLRDPAKNGSRTRQHVLQTSNAPCKWPNCYRPSRPYRCPGKCGETHSDRPGHPRTIRKIQKCQGRTPPTGMEWRRTRLPRVTNTKPFETRVTTLCN